MSTDYDFACFTCKRTMHCGQRFMGSDKVVFGFGSNDDAGRAEIGRWLLRHLEAGHDVRVLDAGETVTDDFENDDATAIDAPVEGEALRGSPSFIDELRAVCRRHGKSLGHEDDQGGFLIHPWRRDLDEWLGAAREED